MNPLELYNQFAPFIQGNPAAYDTDLICFTEDDINRAIHYVYSINIGDWDVEYWESDWRNAFLDPEGGTWESEISSPEDLLDLLCHAVCYFSSDSDIFRYALVSCLYSIPEVAASPRAINTLRVLHDSPWASNLYRSKYGQVDWSLAETLALRKLPLPTFCEKYGKYRSRKEIVNRGTAVPYWVKYWGNLEYAIVEHITAAQEVEHNQAIQVKFTHAYGIMDRTRPTFADKARVKKGDDL